MASPSGVVVIATEGRGEASTAQAVIQPADTGAGSSAPALAKDEGALHISVPEIVPTFQPGRKGVTQVSLRNASVTVSVEPVDVPSISKALISPFTACLRARGKPKLGVLQDISFVLPPGSSTIVIGPPGSGTTTLLRTIAGLQAADNPAAVSFNGRDLPSLRADGVDLRRYTAYCGEADVHEPLLTVRETLLYAAQLTGQGGDANGRVNEILRTFGIDVAADTIVGNSLFRGVSGGQKRRTSLAEAFLMDPAVLCLDQPIAGLDAATARDIMDYACTWARTQHAVFIAAIQGAGPEVVNLFDNVLLLSEGRLLFFGPTATVDAYLASKGMARPSYIGIGDWCLEVVSSPENAAVQAQEDAAGSSPPLSSPLLDATAAMTPTPSSPPAPAPTTESLATEWHAIGASAPSKPAVITKDIVLRENISLLAQIVILTRRQFKLSVRNWLFIALRMANCIVMGAILGTVFLDAPSDGFALKFSLALFAVTFIAFINNAEIPIALLSRAVVYKQSNYGLFHVWSYTNAVMIAHIPLTLASDVLFAAILYYIAGYQSDPGRFFFFYLVIIAQDLAISILYRMLSYWTPTQEIAMTIGSAFTAAGLSTGGFFVLRSALPKWMVWLLYISPFWWCVTAMANNEYGGGDFASPFSPGSSESKGTIYMDAFDYPQSPMWQWGAIIFLFGLYLLLGCTLQPCLLACIRRDYVPGARRPDDVQPSTDAIQHQHHLSILFGHKHGDTPAGEAGRTSKLHFPRVTIKMENIDYTVRLKSGEDKQLLHGIAGAMHPGTMTALMGASGAGKTTLLDCIAFRKTVGKLAGRLLFNGAVAAKESSLRLSGYVQQEDILPALSTVSEALVFSAKLRLPSSIDEETRSKLVKAAVILLELQHLESRQIVTLSRGEQKIVAIACELVANPSILYLDEPTTGQDAKSSALIIRAMRLIADSGRTVVCTIHQPSPSIFFSFDNMLLLAPGGHVVYRGPLGHHASMLQQHLEGVPGVPSLPLHVNPAVWMLDVITDHATAVIAAAKNVKEHDATVATGAGSTRQGLLLASGEAAVASPSSSPAEEAIVPTTGHAHAPRASLRVRMGALLHRSWTDYNRNTGYNVSRGFVVAFLATFFGCVYYKLDFTTFSGLQSAFGALLAAPGFLGVILFTIAMPHTFAIRDLIYRESSSGLYDRGLAMAVVLLTEVPYVAVYSLLFVSLFYFMIDFAHTGGQFWLFWLVTFLVGLTYQFAGMMMAGVFPNIVVSQVVGGMTLAVYFLFGGVFISPQYIIKYWKWFYYVDFESWAVRALSMDQFYCEGAACTQLVVPTPTAFTSMSAYAYISDQLEFYDEDKWRAVGVLAGICCLYFIITAFVFKMLNHLKR